jgi:hypothetical protein
MSEEPKRLRKYIPVEEAVARWRKNPAYVKEYDALQEEFARVAAIIKARAAGGLSRFDRRRRGTQAH